jgi:hypothetical protein
LQLEALLTARHAVPLGALGDLFCSAFYPPAADLYDAGDVPFLRCVDIITHPIVTPDQEFARIPSDFLRANRSIRCLHAGEIVLSKVGTPCFASLLHESMPHVALSRTVLGMSGIRADTVDPRYLVLYLRSSVGFDQLMRERELTIQYQLTLDRTRNVMVLLPPIPEQRAMGDVLSRHLEEEARAQRLYTDAETLLLDALGLSDLALSPHLFYTRAYSDALAAGRMDADYFGPAHDQLTRAIGRTGQAAALGDVLEACQRGQQPTYAEGGDVPVITTKHMGPSFLGDGRDWTTREAWDRQSKARLRKYDVLLYGTGAYIGRTNVFLDDGDTLASNHVTIIRPTPECDPVYLALFLNSKAGLIQADRHAHGSAQRELYPDDIRSFAIWRPDMPVQRGLADMVLDAHAARQASSRLLEEAKRMVEHFVLGEPAYGEDD